MNFFGKNKSQSQIETADNKNKLQESNKTEEKQAQASIIKYQNQAVKPSNESTNNTKAHNDLTDKYQQIEQNPLKQNLNIQNNSTQSNLKTIDVQQQSQIKQSENNNNITILKFDNPKPMNLIQKNSYGQKMTTLEPILERGSVSKHQNNQKSDMFVPSQTYKILEESTTLSQKKSEDNFKIKNLVSNMKQYKKNSKIKIDHNFQYTDLSRQALNLSDLNLRNNPIQNQQSNTNNSIDNIQVNQKNFQKGSQSVAKIQMISMPESIGDQNLQNIYHNQSQQESQSQKEISSPSYRAKEMNLVRKASDLKLANASKILRADQIHSASTKNFNAISLPSLGGKRRVHADGLVMLDNHFNMKEAQQKFEIMQNRLKRLQLEEEKAQKNQRLAEKKAQEMLQARSRHYQELMDKIQYYEDKNNLIELQRMKNQLEQKSRKQTIQNQLRKVLQDNYKCRYEVEMTEQQLREKKKEIEELEMQRNKQKWRQIMAQKIGLKQQKLINEKGNETKLVNQYEDKVQQKKEISKSLLERIEQMEQKEQQLLQQLQATQSKQRQVYQSLESMVQVGYSYYSQCYDLKTKKQKQLYPQLDIGQEKKKSPVNLDTINNKNAEIYLLKQDGSTLNNIAVKKIKKKKSKKFKKDNTEENEDESDKKNIQISENSN